MSGWNIAMVGMLRCWQAKAAAAPRRKGDARWAMSGWKLRRVRVMVGVGSPMGSPRLRLMVGVVMMGKPR